MDKIILFLSLFISLSSCTTESCSKQQTTMVRLKEDIFCNYDINTRPVKHHHNKTIVSLTLYPRNLYFDEMRSSLYIDTWIYMTWVDENIYWNPENYDNIGYLRLAPNTLWTPDLSVYNKLGLDLDTGSSPALVTSNGRVYVVVVSDFKAFCAMDLTYWPYDEHKCNATIGSRTYHGIHLDFDFKDNKAVQMNTYYPNRIWKLQSVNATKIVTELALSVSYLVTIKYQFKLKRHSSFIESTVFVPVILLSLMVLFSTLLPFSSERCYYTLALCAAGHIAYLQYLGSVLPHNAENTILIVSYIRDSLIMTVTALGMCLFIDKLSTIEIPTWLRKLLQSLQTTGYTRMFLILQSTSKNKSEEDVNLMSSDDIQTSKVQSILLLIIQRLLFLIYFVIYIFMFIAFF